MGKMCKTFYMKTWTLDERSFIKYVLDVILDRDIYFGDKNIVFPIRKIKIDILVITVKIW